MKVIIQLQIQVIRWTTKTKYRIRKESNDYCTLDLDISEIENDIPHRFCNIRSGLWNIRPEVYTVMHKLKSQYHTSQRQREAANVEVGNYLFG